MTVQAEDTTVITMVVDESGSMQHLRDATIAGFNEYVGGVARDLADTRTYFSAIKFDTRGVRKLQVGVPISEAKKLNHENYQPEGGTPLLDAVGQAIRATDEVMKQQRGTKAVVVIQTDGEENSSQKYNLTDIKQLIERRQAKGWQFVFIGAGINAFADAHKMGIIGANTMAYSADAVGTQAVFHATASNTAGFASGRSTNTFYSAAQSAASGEAPEITKQKMANTPPPKPAESSSAISSLSLTE